LDPLPPATTVSPTPEVVEPLTPVPVPVVVAAPPPPLATTVVVANVESFPLTVAVVEPVAVWPTATV
jgi:hypothetical protein